MKRLIAGFLLVWLFIPGALVFAQFPTASDRGTGGSLQEQAPGGSLQNTGEGSFTLENPLKVDSIEEFLVAILEILLIFAVPLIILMIIYAGFLYVTARGNEETIKKAHSALTWAVVGGVLILGVFIIIEVIQNTVNSLR